MAAGVRAGVDQDQALHPLGMHDRELERDGAAGRVAEYQSRLGKPLRDPLGDRRDVPWSGFGQPRHSLHGDFAVEPIGQPVEHTRCAQSAWNGKETRHSRFLRTLGNVGIPLST